MLAQTPFRVRSFDGLRVEVMIPGWKLKVPVFLDLSLFPRHLFIHVHPGSCFLATMDLSAENAEGLGIQDIEFDPNLDLPYSL